jgi:pimeloyl-ACP methyl ester carboxylesterase
MSVPLPLTQYQARTPDGVDLALYEVEARRQGPARASYLLIHGFVQNRNAYTEGELPAELIRLGGRVFLGELRGHGQSAPGQERGLRQHLELDLPTLIEAAAARSGQAEVVMVGHSMGGMLGYGALGRVPRLSALATIGAPVVLGEGRPLLRAMAWPLWPLSQQALFDSLPTDLLLQLASLVSTLPPRGGPLASLREIARLANPREADRAATLRILRRADRASRQVVRDLLEVIRWERAVVGEVDLRESVRRSALPILAVVGGRDIFAPRASVAAILEGPGFRRILELPEAAHVDLTMGKHVRAIAEAIASITNP